MTLKIMTLLVYFAKMLKTLSDMVRYDSLFILGNMISLKASFQPGRAPHIIIVTKPPTVPGWDLNP